MTRPESPSEGRPKLPVFLMSVGVVAGIRGVRFRMLKALKKFARNPSFAPSPMSRIAGNWKSLPKDKSTDVDPGPVKMLRHRHPGPRVVTSNSVAGLGKMPLIHCCLLGLLIAPPK